MHTLPTKTDLKNLELENITNINNSIMKSIHNSKKKKRNYSSNSKKKEENVFEYIKYCK